MQLVVGVAMVPEAILEKLEPMQYWRSRLVESVRMDCIYDIM